MEKELSNTFAVFDPFCASGTSVVARGFKTEEAAQKWLDRQLASDEEGYVGCFVVPNKDLPKHGEHPSYRK